MRTIGRVELKFDNEGIAQNADYANGLIVELTSKEAYMLKLLQDACKGKQCKVDKMLDDYRTRPEDINMDDLFGLVWTYTKARFAINDFKNVVSQLDETINRLDKINE